MTVKHPPATLQNLFSIIGTKLKVDKPFALTLVQKQPRLEVDSKVIKLTCYDFHEAFNPQHEYNRILNCLELPYQSIKNITARVKGDLAPHTLHLLIPLDDLKATPDYPKLLASIGYYSVIDKEKLHLFINKRRPVVEPNVKSNIKPNVKPNVNVIEVSTEKEAHETMLLRSLERRHPGVQSTYQDSPPDLLKQKSKFYLN